ncbi:hypothetical protein D1872_275880 [compost metagenome]
MFRDHAVDHDIAAGSRCCDHISPRLNPVGNNRVAAAFQLGYAFNADRLGTGALNACAHGIQKCCNIYNLRLFSRIFDNCGAFGPGGRQHNVNGCSHAADIQIDLGAAQFLGVQVD